MSKIVVIHQPDFLPHIGFFHKLIKADLWVVFDNVQFLSGSKSWHNRDKIKTKNGSDWVTVGVKKSPQGTNINKVLLSDDKSWVDKGLNKIKESYREAPFYNEIYPVVEELYKVDCKLLIEFNMKSIEVLMELFDININKVSASSLDVSGKKTELLLNISKMVDAAIYLTGEGSRDYLDEDFFNTNRIKVEWQNFKHPIYNQLYGEFVPYLSAIDLFFNCGIEESRKIIRKL